MSKSTLSVTTAKDSVPGSLRYAIDKANRSTSPVDIEITSYVKEDLVLTGGEIKISSNFRIVNRTGRDLTITLPKDLDERLFNILPSSTRTIVQSLNPPVINSLSPEVSLELMVEPS